MTSFTGHIDISPPLMQRHIDYIQRFYNFRHAERSEERLIQALKDEVVTDDFSEAVNLKPGPEGRFFVGSDVEACCTDWYCPAEGCPSLVCPWTASDDGSALHAGRNDVDEYVEWMEFVVEYFIRRWGYMANGKITFDNGRGNKGMIRVRDNNVEVVHVKEQKAV